MRLTFLAKKVSKNAPAGVGAPLTRGALRCSRQAGRKELAIAQTPLRRLPPAPALLGTAKAHQGQKQTRLSG